MTEQQGGPWGKLWDAWPFLHLELVNQNRLLASQVEKDFPQLQLSKIL